MQMTDTDILGKYNRSDDKKGMVQILADLNGCDKDTIQQILIQGGVPESEFAPKKRRKRQPPAPKPDPAKTTAAMPPEDESLPLPFSDDDMGIGDDEYGGAMTGGRGSVRNSRLRQLGSRRIYPTIQNSGGTSGRARGYDGQGKKAFGEN